MPVWTQAIILHLVKILDGNLSIIHLSERKVRKLKCQNNEDFFYNRRGREVMDAQKENKTPSAITKTAMEC